MITLTIFKLKNQYGYTYNRWFDPTIPGTNDAGEEITRIIEKRGTLVKQLQDLGAGPICDVSGRDLAVSSIKNGTEILQEVKDKGRSNHAG